MILPELLPLLAIHLYALGTAAVVAGILARNEWLKRAALVLTVLAFTAHTLLLGVTFCDDGFAGLTRSVYVQLLAWCITLIGLIAWLRSRYESLLLIVAPFSLLTFLIALLLRHAETPLPPVLSGMTFTIHITAIFISIGLMALAFGAGVLFLIQAKTIKVQVENDGLSKGPPRPFRPRQNQCAGYHGRLSAVHGGHPLRFRLRPHQLGNHPFRRPQGIRLSHRLGSVRMAVPSAVHAGMAGPQARDSGYMDIHCVRFFAHRGEPFHDDPPQLLDYSPADMEQHIYLIGLNYRTAGVEVRERFALTDHCSPETWAVPLRAAAPSAPDTTTLEEALILSTCNRVEILAVGQGDVPKLVLEAWAAAKGRSVTELAPYVYIHQGREAITHLFTVASSLDLDGAR